MALTDDLVSWWKMDEASGGATDAHGTNHLAEKEQPWHQAVGTGTGIINTARDFTNAGDPNYLWINDNASLSGGNIDFMFQCWFKPESLGFASPLIAKWPGGGNNEYLLTFDPSTGSGARLIWYVSNDGSAFPSVIATTFGALTVGNWHCIHCWHSATADQIGISVNAGTANTTAHTTGVFDGVWPFLIGRNPGSGTNADGLIDECAFWRGRVPDASERTALYNGGAGLAYGDLGGGGISIPVVQHLRMRVF